MSLRIAFMGSPDFAVPTLEAILAAGHQVACVYSQPPRPAGRGKQLTRTAVHEAAERHGIEVRTPENFRAAADKRGVCGAEARCGGGGGLWPAAAKADPRCAAAGLFQHPRLDPAALARGGADPSRRDGGRQDHRRAGDEDGCGAGYRAR